MLNLTFFSTHLSRIHWTACPDHRTVYAAHHSTAEWSTPQVSITPAVVRRREWTASQLILHSGRVPAQVVVKNMPLLRVRAKWVGLDGLEVQRGGGTRTRKITTAASTTAAHHVWWGGGQTV